MPGRGAFSDSGANPDARDASARAARLEALLAEVGHALPGATARDMAGPLAARAVRVAEFALIEVVAGMDDRDERVRATAARTALQVLPKIAELAPPEAPPPPSDEDRDTALRAALESPEFCALLVTVVAVPTGAARAALIGAGWLPPEG